MQGPTYPPAAAAAPAIHARFARHHDRARAAGRTIKAALPDAETIERLIGAGFWASLRREEGYVPRVSLAYLPPDHATHPMRFERPLPLHSAALAKVAPAVERAGIHLAVWHDGSALSVWGAVRVIPSLCFVLEVSAPGLLVVKHHGADQSGKFFNIATLEGDQVKIIDQEAAGLRAVLPVRSSLFGVNGDGGELAIDVLVELAVSMRAHGRGGALLVVPASAGSWTESVVSPLPYAVSPPFPHLALLALEVPDEARRSVWRDDLRRSVEAVAGLTAVDGATIVTADYHLLAFGAKLTRRRGRPPVEHVLLTEPIEGQAAELVQPGHLGGTRHFSAAQFIHDQRDAVALVASQDGRFTVFGWSEEDGHVQAHRVEALLLSGTPRPGCT